MSGVDLNANWGPMKYISSNNSSITYNIVDTGSKRILTVNFPGNSGALPPIFSFSSFNISGVDQLEFDFNISNLVDSELILTSQILNVNSKLSKETYTTSGEKQFISEPIPNGGNLLFYIISGSVESNEIILEFS